MAQKAWEMERGGRGGGGTAKHGASGERELLPAKKR